MIARLAALLPLAVAGGENRLWLVDLELRGPCDELRLDCGPDGETVLAGPFLAGEERRLAVPVPVRSPLGVAGLAALPLPRLRALPAEGATRSRVLGWSAEQPGDRLERLSSGLLARARPPVPSSAPRARAPEVLVVLVAVGLCLALRRRLALAASIALLAGSLAFALARSRAAPAVPVLLVEWEEGGSLALRVSAASAELPLPRERLEVSPEGRRLEFRVSGPAPNTGTVVAGGARLFGLEGVEVPSLHADRNDWQTLAAAWSRDPAGRWTDRGPWARGAGLGGGAGSAGPGTEPPGWLASALAPGRGVLLGRTGAGEWVRCVGFEAGRAGD